MSKGWSVFNVLLEEITDRNRWGERSNSFLIRPDFLFLGSTKANYWPLILKLRFFPNIIILPFIPWREIYLTRDNEHFMLSSTSNYDVSSLKCLIYLGLKSPIHHFIISATLRECFPTRVLLGSISDPLVPLPACSQKDITDDRSGAIFACLCDTDFCNDGEILLGSNTRQDPEIPRSSPVQQSKLCPPGFDLVDGSCYFFSSERVGWIEARKKCESLSGRLVSLESEKMRRSLAEHISRSAR